MNKAQYREVEEWGLPPEQVRELLAELEDHAAAEAEAASGLHRNTPLAADEAALALTRTLADPAARRQLGAAHALTQLWEHVLRLPRGRGLLGLVYAACGLALAIGGDMLALRGPDLLAWSAQGGGLGLLAAGGVMMIQRGFATGPGVALARLLQLIAGLGVGLVCALHCNGLLLAAGAEAYPRALDLPLWLDARWLTCSVVLLATLGLAWWRGRALAPALGVICAACALYPGAPWPSRGLVWTSTLAFAPLQMQNGGSTETQVWQDAHGHIVVCKLVPIPGPFNVLGRAAPDMTALMAQQMPGPKPLPSTFTTGRGMLLQPAPDPLLTARVLAWALLYTWFASLAALYWMLRVHPSPLAAKALLQHCVFTMLVCVPYAQAVLVAGLHPVQLLSSWGETFLRTLSESLTAPWAALILGVACLLQLVLYRVNFRPSSQLPLMLSRGMPR